MRLSARIAGWGALLIAATAYAGPGGGSYDDGGVPGDAWVVSRQAGRVALTEVWVGGNGQAPRRLGAFPGRSAGVGRAAGGDRILYREQPLSMAGFGLPVAGRTSPDLVPAETWVVPLDGGKVHRLRAGEVDASTVRWFPDGAPTPAEPGGDVLPGEVLNRMETALHTAAMAYNSLRRWEFRTAEERYRRAAREFERLGSRFASAGLFREPFQEYARALKRCSARVRRQGARWVCREQLSTIGDLLQGYGRAHGGKWPDSLSVLERWARGSPAAGVEPEEVERVFRSPVDPEKDRTISYLYRPGAREGEAVVTSPFYRGRLVELVRQADGFRVADREAGRSQVDSLLATGVRRFSADPKSAVPVLQMVTYVDPDLASGYSRLGYAYLETGQIDRALSSFERAVIKDHRLAEAYNGLGLVYWKRPKGKCDAVRYFQKALEFDRNYLDARFHLAQVRLELQEYDAKRDADKVLAMDPKYAPAYLLLGKWYENQQNDYENAVLYYGEYLALRPHDVKARRLLAHAYLKTHNFNRIIQLLSEYVREHPGEVEMLPVLAQACIKQDRLEWADVYFKEYLKGISPKERSYYEDVSLLLPKKEAVAFEQLTGDARQAFLKKFWADRDPNLTTAVNERWLEHCRRVWYSRENFGSGIQPWDRRGEVYVRFGEPDYRSRSNMQNFNQTAEVQRVQDRIARSLYGSEAADMSFLGGPVYPVRSLRAQLGSSGTMSDGYGANHQVELVGGSNLQQLAASQRDNTGKQLGGIGGDAVRTTTSSQSGTDDQGNLTDQGINLMRSELVQMTGLGPMGDGNGGGKYHSEFSPVTVQEDASMVPWETWVYTRVDGGIEITFTDENHDGNFDYAPPPMDAHLPFGQLVRFNEFNPRRVAELAARVTPDYYVPPHVDAPMQFYYDLADFQSPDSSRSRLEVYLGIPHRFGRYVPQSNQTEMVVERTVAVLNEKTGAVYRRRSDLRFRADGNLTTAVGGFVPDVMDLEVPPGDYRMEVLLRDRLSGRQGRYREQVTVDDFRQGGLELSGLELAWHITEGEAKGKFSKGDLQVVPMPTRTYERDHGVFVYFEVYGLRRDAFGQTHYQVEYTIGPREGFSPGGLISRMVRTFTRGRKEVAVGYEQTGMRDVETVFTELNLKATGTGRDYVRVEVTDLNSGQKASREATFVVAK